jgi:uncharacterized protein YndB with AHSA1/START domain
MSDATFDPGPPSEVDCERDGDRWTLVFVRDLRYGREQVWAALTEPARLAEWAPFSADRDLDRSGVATLTMIDGDTAEDLPAEVRLADRPKLLEYPRGSDVLRWELDETATGTRLTLRHSGDDPDALPKAAAGWHLCLVVAERRLAGEQVGPIRGQGAMAYGWQALHDAYADRLEPSGR